MSAALPRGFSLIELMATLAILGLLAVTAFPIADLTAKRLKEQELRYQLRQVRDAIDAYKRASDEGRVAKKAGETGYPPALEALAAGVEDAKSPQKAKIYFLRRIPTDPFADPGLQGAASWGKRSYASAPGEPKPGEDVYDVYSMSPLKGINGIPYRDW
ncbi:MAG: type II secretion system protein [Burkholderiales bacterium]|nr:type II secretion system protein [Burkholderiales bacterium]